MTRWLLLAPLAGCATVASTCPTGTTLVTHEDRGGRTELCAQRDRDSMKLPTVGRSYETKIDVTQPPSLAGVEGPFTQWYPNGKVAAHGRYLRDGSQSLPEGMWAFWYPDGKRQVYGLYHHGVPTGCFVALDESGAVSTGTVTGTQLTPDACSPPPDNEVAVIEGKVREPLVFPWADIDLRVFGGPNYLGLENGAQSSPHPSARFSTEVSMRALIGRLRVGPVLGVRFSDGSDGLAYYAGAAVGWELPKFHPRLDTEIVAELAADYISPNATILTGFVQSYADVSFWTPLAALQANLALVLSPGLSVLVGLRLEDTFKHDVNTTLTYCDDYGKCSVGNETWSVGDVSYGVNVGIRIMLF